MAPVLARMLAAISYDPIVHIELGPLDISPHGVGIAVGFLLGARLMLPAARRKGITDDDVYALLTRAAIGAIIGARIAYVMNHFGDYESPLDALKVWEGGISLLGGFFGAILLALPEMKKRGLSFWKVMDAAAPGMALGVLVGRIGDLIVADHLGKETDFFLGYKCPPPSVDTAHPCIPGTVVHQTALYDLILVTILLGVLLWLRKRRPNHYDGFLITVFAMSYGAMRIFEDFLRADVRRFGLTGSQITALITLLIAGWHLFFVHRTPKWGRWNERHTMADEAESPVTDAAEADGGVPHVAGEAAVQAEPRGADATAEAEVEHADREE